MTNDTYSGTFDAYTRYGDFAGKQRGIYGNMYCGMTFTQTGNQFTVDAHIKFTGIYIKRDEVV